MAVAAAACRARGSQARGARALAAPSLLLLLLGAACAPAPDSSRENEAALLAMHAAGLQAHLDRDAEAMTALEVDSMLIGSRGDMFYAGRAQRLERRLAYLGATRFHIYRDVQPPIVQVARDGSMGWVVAQVELAGVQTNDSGGEDSLHATWAWIETYVRSGDRWLMSGNLSNEKP